ncbi:hypothetical protein AUP68_09158 [Ilyonectria robusta]
MQLVVFRKTAENIADDYLKNQGTTLVAGKSRSRRVHNMTAYRQGSQDSKKIDDTSISPRCSSQVVTVQEHERGRVRLGQNDLQGEKEIRNASQLSKQDQPCATHNECHEAQRHIGDALYKGINDEIEDLTPEKRDTLVHNAFQHEALRARRPTVWTPATTLVLVTMRSVGHRTLVNTFQLVIRVQHLIAKDS